MKILIPVSVFIIAGTIVPTTTALKIAFVGDTNINDRTERNFEAIKEENVDLIQINGDFDYQDDPQQWESFLKNYWNDGTVDNPKYRDVLVVSGNHEHYRYPSGGGAVDHGQWEKTGGYQDIMHGILSHGNLSLASACHGRTDNDAPVTNTDYGEYTSCEIPKNGEPFLHFSMVGWKQTDDSSAVPDSETFIRERLSRSPARWKICVWHEPEGAYNPGGRHGGDKGLKGMYDICREHGAIVVGGHSHVYGRTKLMSSFGSETVSNNHVADTSAGIGPDIPLSCGESIALVTGVGGQSVDGQASSISNFARVYTTLTHGDAQSAKHSGALICDFGDDKAECKMLVQWANSGKTGDFVLETFGLVAPEEACGSNIATKPPSTVNTDPPSPVITSPPSAVTTSPPSSESTNVPTVITEEPTKKEESALESGEIARYTIAVSLVVCVFGVLGFRQWRKDKDRNFPFSRNNSSVDLGPFEADFEAQNPKFH